jgi:hypothetical protein
MQFMDTRRLVLTEKRKLRGEVRDGYLGLDLPSAWRKSTVLNSLHVRCRAQFKMIIYHAYCTQMWGLCSTFWSSGSVKGGGGGETLKFTDRGWPGWPGRILA